jgi:hypothetical protein
MMKNNNQNFPETSILDKRFSRLLTLIQGVNVSIELSRKIDDSLGIRQYEHLKKQYVNEMVELLGEMKVSVQAVEEGKLKEAA